MKRDKDDWLDQKITEELIAMADEREKELMEMEDLQDIDMPVGKFEDIKREAYRRRDEKNRRRRLRPRIAVAVAAALALLLGLGAAGSREDKPEIREYEGAGGSTTRIENSDSGFREYSEEEVCQEIEEKLGVLAPRLIYKPEGTELYEYQIFATENEAIIKYKYQGSELQVYICKEHSETSVNFEMDGIQKDIITIGTNGMEVPVIEYTDSENHPYYKVEFEYLNTYYFFTGMMEESEFIKIIENIAINNA